MTDPRQTQEDEPQRWDEIFARRAHSVTDSRLRRFYTAGVPPPENLVAETPLVALDFETTGMDAAHDEIVSFGLVPFTLRRISIRHACYRVVRPSRELSTDSITIHGLTHSEVEAAPPLESVLDELLSALAGRVVVVHFRGIERPFLDAAVRARIGEGIEFPVIDTMDLAYRVLEARRGWVERILRRSIGSVRLPDCRERYGLPAYPLHHALVDALATAELFQAQVAHHHRSDTTLRELWS